MKCRNCDHETYLLVCERCREAASSTSPVTHCGQCGAINIAGYTFCASCGAKRAMATKKPVALAPASKKPPADPACRRCHQAIPHGIDVCPFCAMDCRPLEERALTVFGQLAVAATFLLLFIVPVYVYFLAGGNADRQQQRIIATSAAPETRPIPAANAAVSSPPAVARTAAPESRSGETESQVAQTISEWIASFQARNLDQHVGYYAPHLSTYFTWHDVSHSAVVKDKQRFFTAYSTITVLRVRDLRIEQTAPGVAVASFLKDWSVSGRGEFSGTVLQRLRFERHGQKWLISSEEELRTLKRHKSRDGGVHLASFARG